jgi:hypothetical protein
MTMPVVVGCMKCEHFKKAKPSYDAAPYIVYSCKAFKSIPEEIRSGREPHNEIRGDQKGSYIFKLKQGETT